MKWIFQEDEYADFIVSDTISVLNNITEKNDPVGNTFMRYDHHIVLRSQIKNKLHTPEVRECIRIDQELHVKLIVKRFSGPFPQWFSYGNNCKLTKKECFVEFSTIPQQSRRKFFSVFEELSQRQFRNNQVFSA